MSVTNDDLGKAILNVLKAGKVPSRVQRMQMARGEMKKAKEMRKEAAGAIKAAHGMMKEAYLAKEALIKAGKKPDSNGDFDFGKAMSHLQKAFGAVNSMKTFIKAADEQLKKIGQAAQSPTTGNADYTVPGGVKSLSQSELTEGTVSMMPDDGGVYSRKNAKLLSPREAQLLERAAKAEGAREALEKMPADSNSRRPYNFDVSKLGGGSRDPETTEKAAVLLKGINPSDLESNDERTRTSASAKLIGNMIMSDKFAKPVLTANFGGNAG